MAGLIQYYITIVQDSLFFVGITDLIATSNCLYIKII